MDETRRVSDQTRRCCYTCRKPVATCYCALVRPFTPPAQFIILIHPDETRRSVATGRMAHLYLKGSRLIDGIDFSDHREVNELLADPALHPVLLYPHPRATNLNQLPHPDRARIFPRDKRLVIFVLDGTWRNARKMLHLSDCLRRLPMISLTAATPSAFHVRKQPRAGCLATIEAIHQLIDLISMPSNLPTRPHDAMLEAFRFMVDMQIAGEARFWRETRQNLA